MIRSVQKATENCLLVSRFNLLPNRTRLSENSSCPEIVATSSRVVLMSWQLYVLTGIHYAVLVVKYIGNLPLLTH